MKFKNKNGAEAMTRNGKVLIVLFNCVINLMRGERVESIGVIK